MLNGSGRRTLLLLTLALPLLAGCPGTVPVAVEFPKVPPPPPGPVQRASSASTAPSLTQRYETIDQALQDSLAKARRQ